MVTPFRFQLNKTLALLLIFRFLIGSSQKVYGSEITLVDSLSILPNEPKSGKE